MLSPGADESGLVKTTETIEQVQESEMTRRNVK